MLFIIFLTICLAFCTASPTTGTFPIVRDLSTLKALRTVKGDEHAALDIWRFKGESPQLVLLWKTVFVDLHFVNVTQPFDDYFLYQSANKSELVEWYDAGQRIFGFVRKFSFWKSTRLFPFASTFVGIETNAAYEISLKINVVDYSLILCFCTGIALFFSAKRLSRNPLSYYFGGSGVGILLSLLLFIFILYRFLPKKTLGLSVLVGGSSFTLYVLYSVWQNFFLILEQYQRYLAIYVVTVGCISFGVSYRFGPPRDVRSQNLIQWTIQLFGFVLIYYGCQIVSVSAAIIALILIVYNFPRRLLKYLNNLRFRYFPPKLQMLTEEEYIQQGAEETRKALEQLREYCRSPKCDSWRLLSKLESPQRFASFVSGNSHLSDDEVLGHDSDLSGGIEVGDDQNEDDSGEEDEQQASFRPTQSSTVRKHSIKNGVVRNGKSAASSKNDSFYRNTSSRYSERLVDGGRVINRFTKAANNNRDVEISDDDDEY